MTGLLKPQSNIFSNNSNILIAIYYATTGWACKQGNEFSSHLPVNERIWAYAAGSMIEVATAFRCY